MSTSVGRFVAEIGADTSLFSGGLASAAREFSSFTKELSSATERIPPLSPTVDVKPLAEGVETALRVVKSLGIQLHEVGQDAAGIRVFSAVGKDIESAEGILRRLGATARVVSAEMAAEFEKVGKSVAAAAVPKIKIPTVLAPPDVTPVTRGVAEIERTAGGAARAFALTNRETGAFTPLGQRAANAAVAVGFGLEAVARGGDAAAGGLRTALRAIASFAPAFGPEGLIVSGVAASTAAIVDLFSKARDEMEATKRKFRTDVAEMIRGGDTRDLVAKVRDIDFGDAAKGFGFGAVGGKRVFGGGLVDLENQRKEIEAFLPRLEALKRVYPATVQVVGAAGAGVTFRHDPIGQLIDRNKDFLKTLDIQIGELRRQRKELTDAIADPTGTGRVVLGAREIRVAGTTDARDATRDLLELERRARDVQAAIRVAQDSLRLAPSDRPDFAGLPAQIVKVYDDAVAAVTRYARASDDVKVRVRTLVAEYQNLFDVQVALARRSDLAVPTRIVAPTLGDVVGPVERVLDQAIAEFKRRPIALPFVVQPDLRFAGVDAAVSGALREKLTLDIGVDIGDRKLADAARAAFESSRTRVQAYARDATQAILESNRPIAEQIELLEKLQSLLEKLGLGGKSKQIKKLDLGLQAAVAGGRGILDIADSFGRVSDEARRAANGILSATEGLIAFREAKKLTGSEALLGKISGGLAIAGGLASFVGSIVNNPATAEHNRILQQNNEELQRLRLDLRDFGRGAADRLSVARAVVDPAVLRGAFVSTLPGGGTSMLTKELARFGLTLADINQLAKGSGIELLDSKGRIVAGSLTQLNEALRAAVEAAFTFRNTLDDRRTKADLVANVFDVPASPTATIQSWLSDLAELAPALFKRFFPTVDLSDGLDANELKAIKKGEQDLVKAFISGAIDLKQFGDLFDKGELVRIITGMEEGFDSLTDAANAATAAIRNAPSWFKIEPFRFAAAPVTTGLDVASPNVAGLERAAATIINLGGVTVVSTPGGEEAAYRQFHAGLTKAVRRSANPDARRLLYTLPMPS